MRVFEIYNAAKRSRRPVARLAHDEASDAFSIAIAEDARPDELPLMLALFAQRGERLIPDEWARRWVEERIPPQGRQNLGEILRAQGLDRYDEIALLTSAEGRSAQDDFLIREMPAPRFDYAVVPFSAEGAHDRDESDADADADADAGSPARSWCATLGPEIAERRRAAGMTQRQLAEKTGIDQAAISRIESGRANPTLNTLDALVEGVGFSLLVRIV